MSSSGQASEILSQGLSSIILSATLAATHVTLSYPLYQWKPLSDPSKQIRILKVLPSTESNEIRCSLEVKPLIQEPPLLQRYRALSYVWGDPNGKLPIAIVENNKPFKVYVTKNLFSAIEDLRRPANAGAPNIATPPDGVYGFPNLGAVPLCLWIDAVCIDQSNYDERSAQIQIMGEIYARSCGVLVWLPPTLEMMASPLDLTGVVSHEGGRPRNGKSWIKDYKNFLALKAFFRSPWWFRVWVVQEVIFGPNPEFVFGDSHLSWLTLREVLDSAGLIDKYNPETHTSEENEIHRLAAEFIQMDERKRRHEHNFASNKMKTSGATIDSLLWEFRARKTSIMHDKIYGLLSLADNTVHITPDYKKPVEVVYCELAKALITRNPRPSFPLDHIGFTNRGELPRTLMLPSWVPDWNPSAIDSQLLARYDPELSPYCADDHILGEFPTLLHNVLSSTLRGITQLEIRGIELGYLTVVSSEGQDKVASIKPAMWKWPSIIANWASLVSGCPTEDFVRIVLSDRREDRRTRLPSRTEVEKPLVFEEWYQPILEDEKTFLPDEILEKFAQAAQGWTVGRTSRKGYVLVPLNAREKDLICVAAGSSTPFVLRGTGNRDSSGVMQYQLVGRCYVHNFMDGEAMVGIRTALKTVECVEGSTKEKEKILKAQLKPFVLV
ncbi:heterokaryon incompatibility protein-domain-containing protein [Tricladium varicosporioides]|nr:heterokaryon incompatibility protein-domain-containing protein [Hymenoscyphus varicosporioides]